MQIADWLLDILTCPNCKSPLTPLSEGDELACASESCGLIYPVRDDIPVLLLDEARKA
ncbi:hypothetical protein Ssi03_07290 [Sphaerisporangium siamense]|uniref:Uncharacterized protein YbaR (Trm112 family) n=1 Tax=Sphaerisporangium siamense TaxID=795645 RepID=A0A7W7DFI0_9ACTN|nr:uncharacterized protein YbaR (Trm112 family) [Sphaerisporangium siamense]GII82739.1 hypothetical protein Ssi03_07290 [Sphaerisporangium siamense]